MTIESRNLLLQELDDAKIDLTRLLCALGENTIAGMPEKTSATIKQQLAAIAPALEQLYKQKEVRLKEFSIVQSQIEEIRGEITEKLNHQAPVVDESDLSLKKLEECQYKLCELQTEKSERLHEVLKLVPIVHDLCSVLVVDLVSTINGVHPSLNKSVGVQSKSISNATLSKLARTVSSLKEDKKQRLKRVQEIAGQLTELWNLMDIPDYKRFQFEHITCYITATVDGVIDKGALFLRAIDQAEAEVKRLDLLKKIAFKKQIELEKIYARSHIDIDYKTAAREKILSLVDSGNVEPWMLVAGMDRLIVKAKEEALSRKEIVDMVKTWISARKEETWLEEALSRKEIVDLVNEIPVMVDTLVSKTRAWEKDNDLPFTYDGNSLLTMLDEYVMLRHKREEEKRRLKSSVTENSDQ